MESDPARCAQDQHRPADSRHDFVFRDAATGKTSSQRSKQSATTSSLLVRQSCDMPWLDLDGMNL